MTRRPTVNRTVPAAVVRTNGPVPNRQVAPAARPKPPFDPNLLPGAVIVRTRNHPEIGMELERGEIVLAEPETLGSLAAKQPFHVVLYMSSATYGLVRDDEAAQHRAQAEIAVWPHQRGMRQTMGVQTRVASVGEQRQPTAIVDRNKPGEEKHDLELFVAQVSNLFLDLQGFDMSRMTGETRLEFYTRYQLLRDKARKYRTLMTQAESAFEILQKKMMELADS